MIGKVKFLDNSLRQWPAIPRAFWPMALFLSMCAISWPQTLTITALTASGSPAGITVGPDGALWFTENQGNRIGRMTTAGVYTHYEVPTPRSGVDSITVGPDGALWFTENQRNNIGRITTDGGFTEYVVTTPGSGPAGIATGPDGALWFTESAAGRIGRITRTGEIGEYPIPTPDAGPRHI